MRINPHTFAASSLVGGILGGILVVVLVMFGVMLSDRLEPPIPGPPKAGQNQQNARTSEANETGSSEAAPSEDRATQLQADANPTDWQKGSEGKPEKANPSAKQSGYPFLDHWGWPIVGAVLNLAATIAIAILAYRQWRTAQLQAEHMAQQSSHMQRSLGLTRKELRITASQLKLTEGEFEQTKAAAEAATMGAKAAEATVEQMRLEQRAWLGVSAPQMTAPATGVPYAFSFCISNSGKNPGTITKLWCAPIPLSKNADPAAALKEIVNTPPEERATAISPGQNIGFHSGSQVGSPDQSTFEGIESGDLLLYCMITFAYHDTNGTKGVTIAGFVYQLPNRELRLHQKLSHMR